jgi:hypothetical protein
MKVIEQPADLHVWKLVLAYDGTEFHGWQVQPDCATVQGELRDAIARITGEDVLPQGSGRTDRWHRSPWRLRFPRQILPAR